MRFSLLVPSRYRPERLAAMVTSAAVTISGDNDVEACIYLDDDDPALDWYRQVLAGLLMPVHVVVGPRIVLGETWNKAAERSTGDVVMLAADDLRFRTDGWDRLVADAVDGAPDGIALVYGRDGIADERMATHPFLTRRWVDAVGRVTAPHFPVDYVDLWLHDVARMVGRARYLPELYVEHMHCSVGKAEVDACTTERLARAVGADLPGLYASTLHEREAEAGRLRAAMARR